MARLDDPSRRLGRYEVTAVGGERVRAYAPPPLPPIPPIDFAPFQGLLDRANRPGGLFEGFGILSPKYTEMARFPSGGVLR